MTDYNVVMTWPADKPGVDTWHAFTATVDGVTLRCSGRFVGSDVIVEYPCRELLMMHLALMQNAAEDARTPAAPPAPVWNGRPPATSKTTVGASSRAAASRSTASSVAPSSTSARLPGTEPSDYERRAATARKTR